MIRWQRCLRLASLTLAVVVLAACGAPAAAPTPDLAPAATAQLPEPEPTSTVPPTATAEAAAAAPTTEPATATPNAIQAAMTADAAALAAKPSDTPVPPDESCTRIGELTSEALAGNLLGDPTTRKVWVRLPPGYDYSDKRYPVVYVLHDFARDTQEVADLLSMVCYFAEPLMAAGDVGEMILVSPDASNQLGASYYRSSPTIGDYETYVTQELVGYMDANYRTIANRDGRGLMGCGMGGDGAMHLALTYPEVFGAVAAVEGIFDLEELPSWEHARAGFGGTPQDLEEWSQLPGIIQFYISQAAVAAPNPDNPPFYLDMPFEVVDGEPQIVEEVREKIIAGDSMHDVEAYLDQPTRLNGIMIYHGKNDPDIPVEQARALDRLLTDLGLEHQYLEEVGGGAQGRCNSMNYTHALQFMSDHLTFEMLE